jgi:twinkle protein
MADRADRAVKGLVAEGIYRDLGKRGLRKDTLAKFGYTDGKVSVKQEEGGGKYADETAQIAPYYSHGGELVAQHIRLRDKRFLWYGKPKGVELFGQRIWRDKGKRLIITEGEIDAMSISQCQDNKYPVVSIPNGAQNGAKSIKDNLEWIERFDTVVFCFDNDEHGRKASQECAILLTPSKARIATLPLKDANDMLVAGRIKELIDCLWGAKEFRPDGIVSGSDMLSELLSEPVKGFDTPYPMLNEKLHGIRKGELYMFTAGSGIGKSTLVHEIGYKFLTVDKLTLGVMALEENKRRTAERYVGISLNKPIHISREDVTEDDIVKNFKTTLGTGRFWLYDHFGSTQIDGLLSKMRYMAVGLEVDFIILDHISIVISGLDSDEVGSSERETIDKLMTRLRTLVEETGIGVLAVVHLKRPEKGKSFTEGRQVSLSDLRGSGSLEQLSDAVIALERDQQDEDKADIATMRVLKNRYTGMVGVCDTLEYNHYTGRLLAHTPFGNTDGEGKVVDIPF